MNEWMMSNTRGVGGLYRGRTLRAPEIAESG